MTALDEWWSLHSVSSARIGLRPWRASDRDALIGAADEEVVRSQGWRSADLDLFPEAYAAELAHLERSSRRRRRAPSGCPADLVVTDLDGVAIGTIVVRGTDTERELGWWLGSAARGRGLSKEMLVLGLAYVHGHLGIETITMETSPANVAALRQIEGCGCELVGESTRILPNGTTVPARMYRHHDSEATNPIWPPPCRTRSASRWFSH